MRSRNRSRSRNRWVVGAAAVAALATGGGVAVAVAADGSSGDDRDTPISGPDLQRASEAALAETGGGKVTDTEVGDEEGYYEVEVTLGNGEQVDVHLAKDFTVISTETEGAEDDADDH